MKKNEKKKRKKNENKNKNVQDNRKKDGKKKRKKLEHCWTQHMKKKKEERTDIFSRIDSTSLHRLKKEEKKTEHFWTVIVILFRLVVKWNFLSLFEFKGDIGIFFLFILWNLTKTIYRRFYSRFTNICNYVDSKIVFFRIWGFRGIGIGGGGFCFEESVADVRIGQTFIQLVSDCWWVDGKESNSIKEFTGPWSCSIF